MVGFDPAGWWLSVDPMLSNYEFLLMLTLITNYWLPQETGVNLQEEREDQTLVPLPPSCRGGTGHVAVFYREFPQIQPLEVCMALLLQVLRPVEAPRSVVASSVSVDTMHHN